MAELQTEFSRIKVLDQSQGSGRDPSQSKV
jgi:hypothetical protein